MLDSTDKLLKIIPGCKWRHVYGLTFSIVVLVKCLKFEKHIVPSFILSNSTCCVLVHLLGGSTGGSIVCQFRTTGTTAVYHGLKYAFPFMCVVVGSSCSESTQFELRTHLVSPHFHDWSIDDSIPQSILRGMDRTELLLQVAGPKDKQQNNVGIPVVRPRGIYKFPLFCFFSVIHV